MFDRTPSLGIAAMPERPAAEYTHLAKLAEECGFDCLWIPDERFWRDIAVCMSVAAVATQRIRIGCAVTDPYVRHPALTAQIFASIDELSGGRVICGIGAGVAGFEALGLTRQHPVRAIREAVELMRILWRGDHAHYRGQSVSFNGALDFTPLRSQIPICIAGRGPNILSLAGEVGDGAMIGSLASPPALEFGLKRIAHGVARAERSDNALCKMIWLHTAISNDVAAAERAVSPIVAGVLISSKTVIDSWGVDIPEHLKGVLSTASYGLSSPSMAKLTSMLDATTIAHFAVAGDTTHVSDSLRALFAAGIDHVAVLPWLVPGQSFSDFATELSQAVVL